MHPAFFMYSVRDSVFFLLRLFLSGQVCPGEVLYLPSLWHHQVEQRTSTQGRDYVVAVNFWWACFLQI